MGETYARVLLKVDGKKVRKRLLVDTGATYSWVREKTLKGIGIKPMENREFETIVYRGRC